MRLIELTNVEGGFRVFADGIWSGVFLTNELAEDLNSYSAMDLRAELKIILSEDGFSSGEVDVIIEKMKPYEI